MVQNLSANQSMQVGVLNRLGINKDGRVEYKIASADESQKLLISVPQNQADIFEKSYNDLMKSAIVIQKHTADMTPEKLEKRKSAAKWTIGIPTAIGGLTAVLKTSKLKTWKQVAWTAVGTITGMAVGSLTAKALFTPPGMDKFKKATDTLTKLDIKHEK